MDEKKDCQRISADIDRTIHEYLLTVDRSNDDWESQIPEDWFNEIDHLFHLIGIRSQEENYDWQFCSLKVYKSKIKDRKYSYFNRYKDAVELDFWNHELKGIKQQLEADENVMYENAWLKFPIKLKLIVNREQFDGFMFSQKAKERYILKKIRKLGKIQSDGNEIHEVHIPEEEVEVSTSIAIQMAYLHELGILEFLKAKYPNISNNQIAKLVSKFTGINPGTSQPAINSILSDNKESKSYPLSPRNLKKVRESLADLGFFLEA